MRSSRLFVCLLGLVFLAGLGTAPGAANPRQPLDLLASMPDLYAYYYLPLIPKTFWANGVGWDSSFNVVNTTENVVNVKVYFFDQYGGMAVPPELGYPGGYLPNPFTLGARGSVEILPFVTSNVDLPAGSTYSVVMTATGEIAAIANLTTWILMPAGPYYNGSYSGAASGATAVYMPSVVWNYYDWNSHIAIQNTNGYVNGVDIIFYTEESSAACFYLNVPSIPPYAFYYLDVGTLDLSVCDTNADGYNGSARLVSSGDIIAVDNQTAATTVYGPAGRTQTYTGFSAGSTDLYLPALYYGYYGWDSSVNVQNIGDTDATVSVEYTDGYSFEMTIPLKGSALLYQYTEGQAGHHTAGTKFGGFVRALNGGPLVAVVNAATNQPWPGGWSPHDQAQTYSAPTWDVATDKIVFPQIMREYYGWYTSYSVQNVSNVPITILVSYDGMGSLCQDIPYGPIAPLENVEFYQGGPTDALCPALPGAAQPGDWNIGSYRGSVTVRVDGVGWIVGVANQTNFSHRVTPDDIGDWSMTYNGLNP